MNTYSQTHQSRQNKKAYLTISLSCILILFLALPARIVQARSSTVDVDTAFHTIQVDGDLSDWDTDELMEISGENIFYITWDASSIYLGLSNAYLGDDPTQDKSFFVCLDTNPIPGIGAPSDGYANVSFNTSHFAPEYCFYFAGSAGFYEWSTWNGNSWVWNGWRNDGSYYNWPGNPAINPGSELTILRADINNPSTLRLAAWITPEQPVPSPLEDVFPKRNPTGTNPAISFSYSFSSLGSGISPNSSVNQFTISEMRIDHPGADTQEYFELEGPANFFLNDLTYLVIGDGTGGSGVIENITSLDGYLVPSSGFFVGATSTFNLSSPDLVTTLVFENSDNVTHMLVQGFTGTIGQDLDTNDDGVLEITPWFQVLDLIALIEEPNPPTSTEYHYGPPTIGPDNGFVPGHAYWCSGNWVIGQFDYLIGDDSPGSPNCVPDLAIEKNGSTQVLPGLNMDYQISLENIGNSPAANVMIDDLLPPGTSYLSDNSGYPCPACTPGATGSLQWDVGPTDVGYSDTFTLTVQIDAGIPFGSFLTNTISITTSSQEFNLSNNSDQWLTQISLLDLVVNKEGPLYSGVNEQLIYTIQLYNNGYATAEDVIISDTLPLSTTYISDDSGITPSNPNPGVYVWMIGDILTNTNFTFHLTATTTALPGNSILNTVTASTTTPGDDPSNNTDQVETNLYSLTQINEIQGVAHRSPLESVFIEYTRGIVTAIRSNGFYLQDPNPDQDEFTSEALFVFTDSNPNVSVGDDVLVSGTVTEYRPGNVLSNLTLTELIAPTLILLSTNNLLPEPIVIGTGGRLPPTQIISDDAENGDLESPGTVFDPDFDGVDFYESMEAMRVQINDGLAVGPTNSFGEIPVLGDLGENAGYLTPRYGIVIQEQDFNPERVIIDDALISTEPQVNTGDIFNEPILGILDYSFGNYKLLNTTPLSVVSMGLISETTYLTRTAEQLTIATYNVENLDPNPSDGDDDSIKFTWLADQIVNHLQSPDIIALQEIQDNTGTINDGVVEANLTYETLINAIVAIGGPIYEFREISPLNNSDGGAPGGNIRVAFLFRIDRGLNFVDRPGGNATTPVTATLGADGIELSYSPGRIDPLNDAFLDSRKPLAAEFTYNQQKLIVIVNHLNSKGGDDPLFGRYQPPVLSSEQQRIAQAEVIHQFVQHILDLEPHANVLVLGDLNDFQFSPPLAVLLGDELTSLTDTLPENERYTYIYDGNSQALDHILVTHNLVAVSDYDIVHMNAEFIEDLKATDHDPGLTRLTLNPASLEFEKSVSPAESVPLSGTITYTLTLSNLSVTDKAEGILLTDTLPSEVTFGNWIVQSGAVEEDGTITWTGDLPGGELLSIVFTAILGMDETLYGQSITNSAFFNSEDAGSGSATAEFSVIEPPELSISKEVILSNEPALPSDAITYTISVKNTGLAEALNVHIVDILPSEIVGNDVDILVNIPGNDEFSLTIYAMIDPGTDYGSIITNTVTYDHSTGSGAASVSFAIQALAPQPILSIEKSLDPFLEIIQPGDLITYTIIVSNTGQGDAIGVRITDTLPILLIGEDLDITIDIPAGQVFTMILTATVDPRAPAGSIITNTAHFTHSTGSGSDTVSLTVNTLPPSAIVYLPLIQKE
jgi:uncharacterized repeat protein (TIGR01451 family)